ncbi:MAG: hypothetical protein NC548_13215 [Lachnospiraceae bacterium]|nr:hypothetical protein [Lachnospiraceae bacterium]MCM1230650.1 hypothetical protein [Ruminococcus flavefaciens]MCM1439994.1 hypothetical protein [Roseburia sp.]
MKLDSALKAFTENYDREAIESIDTISRDRALNEGLINGKHHTIKLFNLQESCEYFNNWLKGYAGYKIENKDNSSASDQDSIRNSATKMLESADLFKESEVLYKDLPGFVQGYVEGVQTLLETVDFVKESMSDHDVDPSAIGDVNDFCDQFMTKFDESFHQSMDKILWASGYKSRKILFRDRSAKKTEKPVFI